MSQDEKGKWLLLKRYPFAGLSFALLLGLLIFSLFGRPLFPDTSLHANRQITELPLQKAWTSATLLRLPGEKKAEYWPVENFRNKDGRILADRIINAQGHTIPIEFPSNKEISLETVTFYFGTDALGRDLFSRLMSGIKISLLIGFFAVVVSLVVGTSIGLIAGYYGGWWDKILTTLINSMWSVPTVLLVFAFVLALGRGIENIVLAIGLTMWVDIARLVRGMAKSGKQAAYIQSTKALAYSDYRIISKHLFPNMINPLIILATTNFATAILVEAGISYLGFGIQPPVPSVGMILSENYAYVLGGHYVKAAVPAVIIVIMVLSLNLIGTALKDGLDQSLNKANVTRT